jgi:hypothetical protein
MFNAFYSSDYYFMLIVSFSLVRFCTLLIVAEWYVRTSAGYVTQFV